MKINLLLTHLFVFSFIAGFSNADVCSRSRTVYSALETSLKKNCKDITNDHLLTVTNLELPHIHLKSFLDDDFKGLTNLKRLQFYSLFHNRGGANEPIAISEKVFAELTKLEELVMEDDQLGLLPDDVFASLVSLKILDLTNTRLYRLPKSMLTIPKIEKVYFNGDGMDKNSFQILENTLGNKLEPSR